MSHQVQSTARTRHALLHIDAAHVEWFDRDANGGAQHGRVAVEGLAPEQIASAAKQALEASGASPRACVLALGPDFVEQRFLSLPALSKSELRKVLHRKAASQLGTTPEDSLFNGRQFGILNDAGASGAQAHWLLLAVRRSVITPLRIALRSRGIRVKRVVFGRLAAAGAAHARLGSNDEGSVVIAVEPRLLP